MQQEDGTHGRGRMRGEAWKKKNNVKGKEVKGCKNKEKLIKAAARGER